jgi:hypothetical protein
MPTPNTTPIERAFELAKSGQCRTTGDIESRLKEEGYDSRQLIGRVLLRQLRALIDEAGCGTRK